MLGLQLLAIARKPIIMVEHRDGSVCGLFPGV
jgi:hypothetical protein